MFKYICNEDIAEFLKDFAETQYISLDVETNHENLFKAKFLLLQLRMNDVTYIFNVQKIKKNIVSYIIKLINDSKKIVIGHNIKYDLKVIYNYCDELLLNVYDTMVAEIILTNGLGDKYPSLKDLVFKYKGIELDKDVRATFLGTDTITQEQLIYAALDVEYLEYIMRTQIDIATEENLLKTFKIDMDLVPVIASMEYNGIKLNKEKWLELAKVAKEESSKVAAKVLDEIIDAIMKYCPKDWNAYQLATFIRIPVTTKTLRLQLEAISDMQYIEKFIRENINLNSPAQLLAILTKVYNIPIRNTNEKTLDKFSTSYPIVESILEYRGLAKRDHSFGDNFIQLINDVTGKIHTDYNQVGAVSGRFSSANPNLQNIPTEQEYRSCFIPDDDCYLLCLDYSQEELRMTARYSKDPILTQAYKDGKDVHLITAKYLFDKEEKDITKEERKKGKSMNFAVGYGSTAYGLYKNFQIPYDEGNLYLDKFYNKIYTTLRDFKSALGKIVWSKGFSVTAIGRKRYFKKRTVFADSREYSYYRAMVEREGVNHLIQGTGADCLKIAMTRIYRENPFGKDLKLLLQVHDELVGMAKKEVAKDAFEFMKRIMEEVEQEFLGDIPAVVDGEISEEWRH